MKWKFFSRNSYLHGILSESMHGNILSISPLYYILYYTITFLSGIFCATYKSWIFLKSENTSSARATIMLEDKSLVKKKIINKEVYQYWNT